ncbi:hypothetical protein SAMN05444360_12355 [Chryseobacterium carnipullorum]|uniref:Uncharacterized protein n=1 Tax=Chryseobacterium carnipullorum TaxID=1124835 RepID=A0A1M7MYQ1_CHRCU|nr:hypothetical protein SAMN05444360_12355 [Chryseobacterium carnipullorum]STC93598.1 Uncharacterised protein [Chryseobacterium carnipullorum]
MDDFAKFNEISHAKTFKTRKFVINKNLLDA